MGSEMSFEFYFDSRIIFLTLMVTSFPRGFFMKSSINLSFPTHSIAVGKCSWKKASASERVRRASIFENGAKRVSVNEPSWKISGSQFPLSANPDSCYSYLVGQSDQHERVSRPDVQVMLIDFELVVLTLRFGDIVWWHMQLDIRMLDERLVEVDARKKLSGQTQMRNAIRKPTVRPSSSPA